MVPILLDERGYIIDGMHRWQIAQELGEHCPRRMVEGLSEAQKLEQVLLLNAARRQMAGSEITAAARKLRREGFSTRKIGELLGVSKDTAHRATKGTEPKGGNVTDTRGRKQPARKARPKAGKNGSEPENVNVYAVIMDGLGLCLQATTLANPRKLRLTKEERKALLDRIKKCIDRLQKTFAAWA
jgi:ParB-like chromosome segregation protein Spo0J